MGDGSVRGYCRIQWLVREEAVDYPGNGPGRDEGTKHGYGYDKCMADVESNLVSKRTDIVGVLEYGSTFDSVFGWSNPALGVCWQMAVLFSIEAILHWKRMQVCKTQYNYTNERVQPVCVSQVQPAFFSAFAPFRPRCRTGITRGQLSSEHEHLQCSNTSLSQ